MDILESGREAVAQASLLLTNTCMTEFEDNGLEPSWDFSRTAEIVDSYS